MLVRLGLLLLVLLAHGQAHTLGLAGGRVVALPDATVEVHLDLPAGCLVLFRGPDPSRSAHPLESLVQEGLRDGLVLRDGAARRVPDAVDMPPLPDPTSGTVVPIVVRWRAVPAGTWAVVDLLDDLGLTLVLDQPSVAVLSAVPAEPPSLSTTLGQALVLGIGHIIPGGLDHILFILGLYAAARRWRDLLTQATAFTAAHCLTLGLALGGVVVLSPAWSSAVEIAIAASIAVVALENGRTSRAPGWGRLALVTAFGLIHGLGFAGALAEVAWPAQRFLPALLAANLGIEIGQLIVLGGAALLTAWWWSRPWYHPRVVVPLSVGLGLTGLTWTVQRLVGAWA